jgi:hypothetical protein
LLSRWKYLNATVEIGSGCRAHAFSYFVVVPAESFKLTRRLPRYHFTRSAAGFQHHVRNVRVQRAIERYTGDRGAGECRRGYPMASYLTAWTSWNHVRTAAALMAAVSFTVAFCLARCISESIFGFRQSHEYPGSPMSDASRGIEGAQGLQISKG